VENSKSVSGAVKSMTGFGRGKAVKGDLEVTVEIRSVNHRFLDVSLKLPKMYSVFEPNIRKIVGEQINRGKFEVGVNRTGGRSHLVEVVLDENLAAGYFKCLKDLKSSFHLSGDITVSDMLSLKDIIQPVEKEGAIEEEWSVVEQSLRGALDNLESMRITEGSALWRDIELRLKSIGDTAAQIRPFTHQITMVAKDRLAKRIQELTGGLQLDQDRLAQEAAVIADRSDVTEELTRLESHIEQFRKFGKEGSPLGRKLDFLLQELHREINTLGSKSASTDIASSVINMKTELEKIREQTQNIE
jgi:uncharacterized protein (TIGR00255 family)